MFGIGGCEEVYFHISGAETRKAREQTCDIV